MENKQYLKENGTSLNLTAEDVLNLDSCDLRDLELQRIKNIQEGNR